MNWKSEIGLRYRKKPKSKGFLLNCMCALLRVDGAAFKQHWSQQNNHPRLEGSLLVERFSDATERRQEVIPQDALGVTRWATSQPHQAAWRKRVRIQI